MNIVAIGQAGFSLTNALLSAGQAAAQLNGISLELGAVFGHIKPEDLARPEMLQRFSEQVRQMRQGLDAVSAACGAAADACSALDAEFQIALAALKPSTQ